MKQLELNLQKRLIIVESDSNFTIDSSIKLICKGSDLTEEIAKGLVEPLWNNYKNYLEDNNERPVGNYARLAKQTALESFISAIEAQNHYWGKNPLGDYNTVIKRHIVTGTWQEFEDKTFNPEKTLIFQIL